MTSSPLSILHVTPHFLPSSAGLTTVVRALGKWEVLAGHRVSVATFFPYPNVYGYVSWPETDIPSETLEGLPVERFRQREVELSVPSRWSVRGAFLRQRVRRDLADEMARRFANLGLDVIHVAGLSGLTFAAARFARARGIPWVLSLYGEEFVRFEGPPAGAWARLRRRLSLLSLRRLLADCAAITASGRHLGAMVRELGLRPEAPFIPNGVDVDVVTPAGADERAALRRKHALPQDRPLVLSIQGLAGRKGSHNLLDAFAKARVSRPDAFLVVVGAGGDLESMKARVVSEGLSGSVRFMGFQPHAVCVDLYRASDLYLQLPLREEGVSQTALEAQAAAIPAVLGRCPAMEDSVRHGRTGLLVDSLDAVEAGNAVAALLSDPARRREMGAEGRRWVCEAFSYESISRRYLEVFAEAVRGRRHD